MPKRSTSNLQGTSCIHGMLHLPCSKDIARLIPTYIGGPGTLLPLVVESFMAWTLAISCLFVALWHYFSDRYRTSIASAFKPYRRRRSLLLPLTTHSRREWMTVSDYEGVKTRYDHLLHLIYATMIATKTEVQNEEKHDGDEEPLDEIEYVMVDGKTGHHFSKGEIVAKWLITGKVVPQELQVSTLALPTKKNKSCISRNFSGDNNENPRCSDSCEFLSRFLRTNEVARRLVSLLMGDDPIRGDTSSNNFVSNPDDTKTKNKESKGALLERLSSEEPGAETILQVLQQIWPKLLEMPAFLPSSNGHDNKTKDKIDISIIVPAFREEGGQLATKLQKSLEQAAEPHRIEIIVVHVVEKSGSLKNGDQHDKNLYDNVSPFAKAVEEGLELNAGDRRSNTVKMSSVGRPALRILNYYGGGGRGPCLNYGAKYAKGDILTFLHADTRLATFGWDKAILRVLSGNQNRERRVTCCAFSFAIDTSPSALSVQRNKTTDLDRAKASSWDESNFKQQYYPPGLRAIEVTANIRCKFFALPYGDQCLSIPTDIFRHVGGYPDQCLMEDYELIRLLRMRSAAACDLNSNGSLYPDLSQRKEAIEILFDYKAVCSPRRWQKYGVLYVTYTNSFCVKLYNNGQLTPDELFCQYYGTAKSPNRMNGDKSPWESGLTFEREVIRSVVSG